MINAAVIGMGVGERHAEVYEQDSRCNLVGICDFDVKKQKFFKKKYPQTKIYHQDKEILNDKKINAVSIASYDNYHFKQVMNAIENNKHIIVEKPICLKKYELDQIIAAKNNKCDLILSSNFVLRTNEIFSKFRNDILSSYFGDLYYLEADYYWGRINKFNGWRSEMDFYSIILGAAIHMIDLMMFMLSSKPISVYALGNKLGSKNNKLNFDSFVVILLEFPENLIVKITGNGPCVHPHFHNLKIFGSEKTAVHNYYDSYYLNRLSSGFKKADIDNILSKNGSKNKVISSFIDSIIRPGIKPIVQQNDIFNVMNVCIAAEESIKINKPVNIEY